jgi:hypothetical protein
MQHSRYKTTFHMFQLKLILYFTCDYECKWCIMCMICNAKCMRNTRVLQSNIMLAWVRSVQQCVQSVARGLGHTRDLTLLRRVWLRRGASGFHLTGVHEWNRPLGSYNAHWMWGHMDGIQQPDARGRASDRLDLRVRSPRISALTGGQHFYFMGGPI